MYLKGKLNYEVCVNTKNMNGGIMYRPKDKLAIMEVSWIDISKKNERAELLVKLIENKGLRQNQELFIILIMNVVEDVHKKIKIIDDKVFFNIDTIPLFCYNQSVGYAYANWILENSINGIKKDNWIFEKCVLSEKEKEGFSKRLEKYKKGII